MKLHTGTKLLALVLAAFGMFGAGAIFSVYAVLIFILGLAWHIDHLDKRIQMLEGTDENETT